MDDQDTEMLKCQVLAIAAVIHVFPKSLLVNLEDIIHGY